MFETTVTTEVVAKRTAEGGWQDRILGRVLRETAAAEPQRTAVVDARGRFSYGGLAARADDIALGLLELGGPLRRRRERAVAELVRIRRRSVCVGAHRRREQPHRADLPSGRVAHDDPSGPTSSCDRASRLPSMLLELAPVSPTVHAVVVVGGAPGQGDLSWEALLSVAGRRRPISASSPIRATTCSTRHRGSPIRRGCCLVRDCSRRPGRRVCSRTSGLPRPSSI